MANLFAKSGDPDQMPHSVVSDLGLHCLPIKRGSPDKNGITLIKPQRKRVNVCCCFFWVFFFFNRYIHVHI